MSFGRKLSLIFEEVTSDYEGISKENADNILKSEASNFKPQQLVYTYLPEADMEEKDFAKVDPKNLPKNYDGKYHEIIMDNLLRWKEFPKRGKGVVCFANKELEKEGIPFVAIPFNGAKIGVCPKGDILDSFSFVSINLGIKFKNFDNTLKILFNIFNNPEGTFESKSKKLTLHDLQPYDADYKTFRQALNTVDEQFFSENGKRTLDDIKNNPYNKETQNNVISLIEYITAKKEKVLNIIDRLFDPFENGFQVLSFENFILGENKDKEVWFDSNCLLVKETEYDSLTVPEDEPEGDTGEESDTEEPTEPTEPEGDESNTEEPEAEMDAEEEPEDDIGDELDIEEPTEPEGDESDTEEPEPEEEPEEEEEEEEEVL